MSPKKLFLLDAMALAYRAHFAFIRSNLRNSEGIPTGPIYGFATTLIQLIQKESPSHIAVVWDTAVPTFRHEMDKEYKANRPPQPEDLSQGIPLIKEMIEAFRINNIEKDGFEADDVIGTIADKAEAGDVDVFLVTPDKDLMQLVDKHIKLYKPLNNATGFDIVDIDGVVKYFGVEPPQVTDVLALIGDTSDNIPGVPGVGKKGAPKYIKEYGSVEGLIESADEISSKKIKEYLKENTDKVRLSHELVTIIRDVPDIPSWKELEWNGFDQDKVTHFFKRMGFRSLLGRLYESNNNTNENGQISLFGTETKEIQKPDDGLDSFDEDSVDYRKIDSLDDLKKLVKEYRSIGMVCFDTETTSTDPLEAELLGISLSAEEGKACYIPVGGTDKSGLDTEKVLHELEPLLGDESIDKIAQNMKYDYLVLANAGLEIKGQVFDTMLAAYLIDSNQALNMDALSRKYLNYDPISITELIGKKGKNQKNMSDISVEKVVPYACEDADVTLQLANVLKKKLEEDELEEVAGTIEFPLATVLAKMERHGIRIDGEMLSRFSKELGNEMVTLQDKIFEKAGEEFNLNSPQQLSHILFEKLELPAGRKTKTGKYSTSEDVLSKLANEYELPGLLLDFRALSKLKSTYVDALPQLINPETGRIHTSFNQNVAATGRLSSSKPNLQNIPIRTDRGREIRKAFIAEDGYKVLSADYSQIELRIIASMAEDKAMKEAFERGEDIHSRTAMEIFDLKSIEEVTPDLRRKAKEVNFGIPYGVSAFGLAQRLGIERKEGKAIIDAYFDRFPGIQQYINDIVAKTREQGYVTTLAGRRRYIPDIRSSNQNIRGFAERTAINMPIQGTAADLIKLAMIKLDNRFEKEGIRSRMLIQVHDELVFELHESELETVPEIVRELMESAMELDVPLKVEMGIADNWLDAH